MNRYAPVPTAITTAAATITETIAAFFIISMSTLQNRLVCGRAHPRVRVFAWARHNLWQGKEARALWSVGNHSLRNSTLGAGPPDI